jgi:thiol-disulfide isomerase/thioredoxin
MRHIIIFLLIIYPSIISAQTRITIEIKNQDTLSIKYFEPFVGFSNEWIESTLIEKATGRITFVPNIIYPTFIKIIVNSTVIELLCEPGDNQILKASNPSIGNQNWLENIGQNHAGNSYYNLHYNAIRFKKFEGIREIFENLNMDHPQVIVDGVIKEIDKQVFWVDSLYKAGMISKVYMEYMKLQIQSILSWEAGEQCDRYFHPSRNTTGINSYIKNRLFEAYNPLEPKIRTCLAYGYMTMFYSDLYGKGKQPVDATKVVTQDTPYYTLAPLDLQPYLWGISLFAHYQLNPDKKEICKAFQAYERLFKGGPFFEYFKSKYLCNDEKSNSATILNFIDSDIFSLVGIFRGKRLLIDIWATWCAPCKIEFKAYDSELYSYFNRKNIQLLFISLDKIQHEDKWRKEIVTLNLAGNHLLAGTKLRASIQDFVFDGNVISIPRYVLIDENGKILSVDFTRPSSDSFKGEIEKLMPMVK